MTRTCLHWSVNLSLLAFAVACSGNNSVGGGQNTNLGGSLPYTVGGAGLVGGNGSTAGGGFSELGGAANAGGNGNAGDVSNGGSGESSSLGGGENGGSTQQDTSSSLGVGGTIDVKGSGGSGTSVDVGSGGGSSVDFATGGGISIDVPTGGGSSVDLMTGGASSVDLMTGGASSVDLMTGGASSVDLGTGGGSSIDLGCVETTLTDINVYVTIDATPSGADTEGNMYVGGNLIASGSYTVGMKSAKDCSRYALVVGGDISISGGSINGGKAIYSGTALNVENLGIECDPPGLIRGKSPVDFPALKSTVENLSTSLSKLASNCQVTTAAGNKIVLTGTDPKLNVCNIDSTQLGNIDVNFPKGSSVVVNVSGKTPNWSGAAVCLNGQCDDSDQATYVLWNFYEATYLSSSGIAIQGSVLAPFATLDGGGGHIAGQIIVQYLKGGLEYHPYYFKGCIKWPTAV